jgi:hypothetical protein
MKRLLVLQAGVASSAIFAVISARALAKITGTVAPDSVPGEPSAQEATPPGGCMPIGIAASGKIVFPLQCRDFIERQKSLHTKPAEEKTEKPIAMQSRAGAPELVKPAIKPAKTAPLPKVVDQAEPDTGYRRVHNLPEP